MFGLVSTIVNIFIVLFGISVRIVFFLLKRFDITNGLITGVGALLGTYRIQMHPGIRCGIFVIVVVVSILLQHFFKPVRIAFGVLCSLFAGFMAYGIAHDAGTKYSYIPMVIAAVICGLLNAFSWLIISSEYHRD